MFSVSVFQSQSISHLLKSLYPLTSPSSCVIKTITALLTFLLCSLYCTPRGSVHLNIKLMGTELILSLIFSSSP